MHWTQAAYICLLLVAIAASWRLHGSAIIAAVMLGNLGATMAMAHDPVAVGVADAASAALLLIGPTRARIVAMLFSVMIPVYVSALVFTWPNSTTYAIIDLIALVQLGVIGGVDRGLGRAARAAGRRGNDAGNTAPDGRYATVGVAQDAATGEVT